MKIVTIVTAALVAMLSVAAAATPAAAHPYDQYIRGRSFFGALFGPSIARAVVSYPSNQKPGTIVVSTAQRRLYLVLGNGQALSYGIGVGKAGFAWSGVTQITDKREWPDWTPPDQMLRRRPDLARQRPGAELWHRSRQGGLRLERRHPDHRQARVAGLDAARSDAASPARSSSATARR